MSCILLNLCARSVKNNRIKKATKHALSCSWFCELIFKKYLFSRICTECTLFLLKAVNFVLSLAVFKFLSIIKRYLNPKLWYWSAKTRRQQHYKKWSKFFGKQNSIMTSLIYSVSNLMQRHIYKKLGNGHVPGPRLRQSVGASVFPCESWWFFHRVDVTALPTLTKVYQVIYKSWFENEGLSNSE